MDRIEPCPCCGGPGKLKDTTGKIRQGWVGCPACSLYIGWKIFPDGAIRKWNKRTIDTRRLTSRGLDLVRYFPEAVNLLAEKIAAGVDEMVLKGGDPRGQA